MDIGLTILFNNQDNCIEQTKIIANKDKLSDKSEYFKSLFTNGFSEKNKGELNIDLTHLKCNPSLKHIRIFFENLLENHEYKPTNTRDIKLVMDTSSNKEPSFVHHMEIDYGLTNNIPIHEFYIMLTLSDYFSCSEFNKRIIKYLTQYKKLFGENNPNIYDFWDSNMYLDNNAEDSDDNDLENFEPSLVESFEINLNELIDIDVMNLTPDLTYYTYSKLIEGFLHHIYYIYYTYKQAKKPGEFRLLLKIIQNVIKNNKRITKIVPKTKIKNIELSVDEIKQFPLEDCYELINQTDGLVVAETFIFKVYDFYNVLNYEKSNENLFKLNKQIHIDYQLNQKCIKPKDQVLKLFQEKTKGLFDNMEWNNVILTGGFIFGLLNDLSSSLISSTDIDLFTYNDESEETAKYLLNHFSQFNPYYSVRGKVVTIIIPTFPYDIQIIPTNHSTAYDVIHSFDFSYVKTYYDGCDIFTTLDGLLSLKYGTTICTPTDEENTLSNARLYKTLLKGLSIKYNPDLKNDFIKDGIIDFIGMEKSEEIQMMLNKPGAIRKLAVHLSGVEMLPLIKTYYSSNQVTMNLDNLNAQEQKEEVNEYNKFDQHVIAYTDIEEIVPLNKIYHNLNIQYLSFRLNDGNCVSSISLETGFCPIYEIYHNNKTTLDKDYTEIVFVIELSRELKSNFILKQNIENFKNALDPLWKSFVSHSMKTSYKGYSYSHVKLTYDIQDGECDDDEPYTRSCLKVHVSNNSPIYKKYKKEIDSLQVGHVANFKCLGHLWYERSKPMANMKFMLDSIELKGPTAKPKSKKPIIRDGSDDDDDSEPMPVKKGILSDYNGA